MSYKTQSWWVWALVGGAVAIAVVAVGLVLLVLDGQVTESSPVVAGAGVTTSSKPDSPVSSTAATATTTTNSETPQLDLFSPQIVDVEDYLGSTAEDAVAEILDAGALIEATIDTMGNPNENYRWCCESPPLSLVDIDVLGVHNGEFREESFHGTHYQDLPKFVAAGDRVRLLMRGSSVLYVFDADGRIVHPVPPHQADAIELLRAGQFERHGYGSVDQVTGEQAIEWAWELYGDRWWGTPEHRIDLALTGVIGRPSTCSAADMGPYIVQGEIDDVAAGLPVSVSETRDRLLEAAVSCDYETLYELGGGDSAAATSNSPYSFAGVSSVEELADLDLLFGFGRQIVGVLTLTSYGIEEHDSADGDTSLVYRWPDVAGFPDSSAADVAGDETLQRVAFINNVPVETVVESTIGGFYSLFRVEIDGDGRLLAAISGD